MAESENDIKNFKDLTEMEKTEAIKKMKLERELKDLKRSLETGKKVITYYDCFKPVSTQKKEMTTEEIESVKKRIMELNQMI